MTGDKAITSENLQYLHIVTFRKITAIREEGVFIKIEIKGGQNLFCFRLNL
jgi:hypothetical protein